MLKPNNDGTNRAEKVTVVVPHIESLAQRAFLARLSEPLISRVAVWKHLHLNVIKVYGKNIRSETLISQVW
jgi:hypothetical protein